MNVGIWILGIKHNYRGSELESQLGESLFDFKNLWGIDVIKENLEETTEYKKINLDFTKVLLGRNMSAGEIACAIGHLRIYQEFKESNLEWALILEDDARVVKKLDFLKSGLPKVEVPLIIGIHDGSGMRVKVREGKETKTLVSDILVTRLLELPSCNYGYLMNRRLVEQIDFEDSLKYMSTQDWPYIWPNDFQYFVSNEVFVTTIDQNLNSLIGSRPASLIRSNSYFLPNLIRFMRILKFGVPFKIALYKEFILKFRRIIGRIAALKN
jgi:hypothetical protein